MQLIAYARGYLRSSIARQFVLAVVIVNALLVTMLGVQILGRDRANMDRARIARAEGIAHFLALSSAWPTKVNDAARLKQLARAAASIESVSAVAIEGAAGGVVFAGAPGPSATPVSQGRRSSRAATGSGAHINAISNELIEAEAPIVSGKSAIGSVRVRVLRGDSSGGHRQLAFAALAYGLGVVLLAALIAFLTARSIANRLADLAQVAKRFRLGNREVRADDNRPDEVGSVASGLNAMLETIAGSERALQNVFRIAHIGSWRYVPSQGHVEWSDMMYEVFGLDRSIALPSAYEALKNVPMLDRAKLLSLLESGELNKSVTFNFMIRRPDGSTMACWAEGRVELCPRTGEKVLAGICQDITEREAAAAQLRQAQKMEAVGQLTGGVAHDFNNLLAIVIGNLDLLQEELASGSVARDSVEEALAAALRGSELTKQLLAFSRRQPLTPQRTDLNRLVAGMSSLWRRTLGEAIEVRVHLAENLWPTYVDRTQVETAILNLVINARDAMPEGGVLTVETQNMCLDTGEFGGSRNDIRPGDYSVVTVSDTGCGMSAEVVAQAFEPFFTTKGVGKGSGLGLSMIYGFAKQSGGAVKIYSEIGHGTTVRLYLPRFRRAKQKEPTDDRNVTSPPTGANEKILVVEDNDSVRRVVALQLQELGYRVITAPSGTDALEVLARHQDIDLLFSDVVMPGGMDGFDLARLARERRPHLMVLHTSGFARPAERRTGVPRESYPLLSKPYRKIDLALKIRKVLETGLAGKNAEVDDGEAVSRNR